MKSFLYGSLFGILLGGGTMFLFLNRSTPAEATMKITSSDPKAIISNESLTVKSKAKSVEVNASFETDRAGVYTNTITINRRDLQFQHSLVFQTGYWIQSQLPFLSLSYSYDWVLISAKVGYSFRLQEVDYGIGIGIKYSF